MIGRERNSFVRWGINLIVLALILGVGVYVWKVRLGLRAEAIRAQKRADKAIVREQKRSDHRLCMQINGVKKVLRDKENEDYSHLRRNLALLHIPPTPQILAIAKHDHYRRLVHLKSKPC